MKAGDIIYMNKQYKKIRKIAIIKPAITLFLSLLAAIYLINTIINGLPFHFDWGRLISSTSLPIIGVALISTVLLTHGYIIDDIGITYCEIRRKGWIHVSSIDWSDIVRIEYRPSSVKNLFTEQVIIHSTYGNRIGISDGLVEFKEMVQAIYKKTSVEPDFLGKDLKKIIDD